jgi:hypothetical protein
MSKVKSKGVPDAIDIVYFPTTQTSSATNLVFLLLRLGDISLCYNNKTQFSSCALGFRENGHTIKIHSSEDCFVSLICKHESYCRCNFNCYYFLSKISLLQYKFVLHEVCRTCAENFRTICRLAVRIIFFIASGVGLSPLYCGHFWPVVPAPEDR